MRLISNKKYTYIALVIIYLFIAASILLFHYSNSIKSHRELTSQIAMAIKNSLWNIDSTSPIEYLRVIALEKDLAEIEIKNLEKTFIHIVQPLENSIDIFLSSLKLIPLKESITDVTYDGKIIGSVKTVKYARFFYYHLEIMLLFLLISTLTWYYLSYLERLVELDKANRRLISTARQAGMNEVSSYVLHNVGNVLNSILVSSQMLKGLATTSSVERLKVVLQLIMENKDNQFAYFIETDEGRKLYEYLSKVTESICNENQTIEQTAATTIKHTDHITHIISLQQTFSRSESFLEPTNLDVILQDAIDLNAESLKNHSIDIVTENKVQGTIIVDKHRTLQILTNLIANAKQAIKENPENNPHRISIESYVKEKFIIISVSDSGIGIPFENLEKIFSFGFTTRKEGHGFGLHSAAIAAREIKGRIHVQSEGFGKGSTFTLEIPYQNNLR